MPVSRGGYAPRRDTPPSAVVPFNVPLVPSTPGPIPAIAVCVPAEPECRGTPLLRHRLGRTPPSPPVRCHPDLLGPRISRALVRPVSRGVASPRNHSNGRAKMVRDAGVRLPATRGARRRRRLHRGRRAGALAAGRLVARCRSGISASLSPIGASCEPRFIHRLIRAPT